MRTLVLDATTKTIKVKLDTAQPATNNPDYTVSWADDTGTSFTEGASDGALNGTTDVTIVAAPASSTRRVIKSISIQNRDTAPVKVFIKYDNNGTQRNIAVVTLAVNDTWTLEGVYNSSGALKQTGFAGVLAPTIQKFTSGTAQTYTTPTTNTPLYLRVRMVGGGGGGGGSGSGTAKPNSGTDGTASTFGTSLVSAGGGQGGQAGAANNTTGGNGGTSSLGGAIGTALTGSSGSGSGFNGADTNMDEGGGAGGASFFGGSGGGGSASNFAGLAAASNTGGGGGGAGVSFSSLGQTGGAGGGSGGYVEAILPNPAATYAYTVGAKGTGGTAVGSGSAGGDGGTGYIEVTEYYQ
jgi:hypothetical protein